MEIDKNKYMLTKFFIILVALKIINTILSVAVQNLPPIGILGIGILIGVLAPLIGKWIIAIDQETIKEYLSHNNISSSFVGILVIAVAIMWK
jgi:hypothetical protein